MLKFFFKRVSVPCLPTQFSVLRMLKGYRDASCGWVELPTDLVHSFLLAQRGLPHPHSTQHGLAQHGLKSHTTQQQGTKEDDTEHELKQQQQQGTREDAAQQEMQQQQGIQEDGAQQETQQQQGTRMDASQQETQQQRQQRLQRRSVRQSLRGTQGARATDTGGTGMPSSAAGPEAGCTCGLSGVENNRRLPASTSLVLIIHAPRWAVVSSVFSSLVGCHSVCFFY